MAEKLLAEWFWADRWMGSSAFLLPIEPRGLYREMLTQAWRRGASLPSDPSAIQRACGVTAEEWGRCWPQIERYWIEEDGVIYNETQREVYRECADRQKRAEDKARKAAEVRWGTAKGNAQAMLKHKPEECPPTPTPTPSQEPTPKPTPRKTPPTPPRGDVEAIALHYKQFHPRAKPGVKERKLAEARLKDGYSVDDLKLAIDGNHASPFHCGDNSNRKEYHRLDLILRDAGKVNDFLEIALASKNGQMNPHPKVQQAFRTGDNWVRFMEEVDRRRGSNAEK